MTNNKNPIFQNKIAENISSCSVSADKRESNAMRRRFIVFLLSASLFLFLASFIYQSKWDLTMEDLLEVNPPISSTSRRLQDPYFKESKVSAPAFVTAPSLKELLENKKFNDFALSFTSLQSMSSFLQDLDSKGLELRSSIPQILTARFRVTDPARASNALETGKGLNDLEVNQSVYRPQKPKVEETDLSAQKAKTVDQWLSLYEDRSEWGRGTTLAIIDSFIDFSHPSLAHIEREVISFLDEPYKVENSGHGTSIASIIAASTDDFQGIAPGAKIISIEVLSEKGEGDVFTLSEAIVTAVDMGVNLINLSLGGDRPSGTLENAINYAKDKGVLLVAASGNDGTSQVSYPAKYDDVIGVSALNSTGSVATFSNFGEGVDIAAPGVNVISAYAGNEYAVLNGTSSASAFVSGAILSELARNPGLSPEQVKELLFTYANEAEKPGFDKFSGHGVLNLERIINRNDRNYHDAALVGYYFEPETLSQVAGAGTVPFLVTVQNQGSSWINQMKLDVSYKGLNRVFLFSNMKPGQARSEKLYLDSLSAVKGIQITSKLKLIGKEDQNPENNYRKSIVTIPQ